LRPSRPRSTGKQPEKHEKKPKQLRTVAAASFRELVCAGNCVLAENTGSGGHSRTREQNYTKKQKTPM
jgi:hypothetical protein